MLFFSQTLVCIYVVGRLYGIWRCRSEQNACTSQFVFFHSILDCFIKGSKNVHFNWLHLCKSLLGFILLITDFQPSSQQHWRRERLLAKVNEVNLNCDPQNGCLNKVLIIVTRAVMREKACNNKHRTLPDPPVASDRSFQWSIKWLWKVWLSIETHVILTVPLM